MIAKGEEPSAIMRFAAVILAAGQSSRLGTPKQLLPYQNKTLLQCVIDSARQSGAESVLVVLGYRMEIILNAIDTEGLYIVKNEDWQSGMASSIRCGIAALEGRGATTDGVILVVCDQPFVTAELLEKLIEKQKRTGRPIVASKYQGILGTPVFFHRRFFPELTGLKGDTGARNILMQNADLVACVPFFNGDIDIDTLDDYNALEK